MALDSCRRLVAEFGKDRLMFVKCDVTIQDDMEYAFKVVFEQFGRIDIIINNAGILNDSLWEKQILVNLVSLLNLFNPNKIMKLRSGHLSIV